MRGKQAAVFCTFALNPGKSLDKLTGAVAATGADVIGGLEIKRNKLDEHTEMFAESPRRRRRVGLTRRPTSRGAAADQLAAAAFVTDCTRWVGSTS